MRIVAAARARAARPGVRAAVFVEGPSDHVALVALAPRLGRDLDADGVVVVPMGGFGGIARFLEEFGPAGRGLALSGVVDEAEAAHVLARVAAAGEDPAAFRVCRPDLEAELLRAVGRDGVEAALAALGDAASFARFRGQRAQRDRPWEDQVHRFIGTRAGRKVAAARALAAAVPLQRVPAPLARVLQAGAAAEWPERHGR